MPLNDEQITRYTGQIALKEIGLKGQEKLKQKSILIIGCGALASPNIYYLTASGIGHIAIMDDDQVNLSNLSRQIIHFEKDIDKEKVYSAKEKIKQINSNTQVSSFCQRIDENNIEIIKDYDFIIDCSDNFKTKHLINSQAIALKKACSIAGIKQFKGQVFTSTPEQPLHLKDIFNELNEEQGLTCSQVGVFPTLAGIIGCIQANEALKYLLNLQGLLTQKILIVDALKMKFQTFQVKENQA